MPPFFSLNLSAVHSYGAFLCIIVPKMCLRLAAVVQTNDDP